MNEVSYRVGLEKNQDETREQFAVANMLSYYEKHKPHCQMVYRDFLKNRKKVFRLSKQSYSKTIQKTCWARCHPRLYRN